MRRGEFLPTRRKPILLSGLGLAMFTFAMVAWCENITAQFATVAELFQYMIGTAVVIVLVLLMAPYRKAHWLSGFRDDEPARAGIADPPSDSRARDAIVGPSRVRISECQ